MTLQNGLVHGTKAYLWTDTAWWNAETGEFLCHDTKAFEGFTWPFAGTLSLCGGNPHAVAEHIGNAYPDGLDELLAVTVEALRAYANRGGGGRVMLASFEDRPRLHIVACHELFPGSGYGPFDPVEIDYMASSGNETREYRKAQARGFNPRSMRKLIDAQCRTRFAGEGKLAELGPRVWIGGNVVRLEVSAGGVTSAVERAVH